MINTYITTKKTMSQAWDQAGKRHAITILKAEPAMVTQVKNQDKDGYQAIQVGVGTQKATRVSKPQAAYYQKAGLKTFPKQTREIKVENTADYTVGDSVANPFAVGDIVNAQGVTKGRGFAGAIKRWGFHGGPKTHGQSDRHRAVGSIGQGTSPGRVHRGKRMPGHYGVATKTVRNLMVVHIDPATNEIWLSGPVPGSAHQTVVLTKVGHKDTFTGLKLETVVNETPVTEAESAVASQEAVETATNQDQQSDTNQE